MSIRLGWLPAGASLMVLFLDTNVTGRRHYKEEPRKQADRCMHTHPLNAFNHLISSSPHLNPKVSSVEPAQ